MSLSKKTLIIIGVTLLILVIILSVASRLIILKGFQTLEEKYVIQNVHRTQAFISENLANLKNTGKDWSSWDDTYNFIVDQNRNYIEVNIVGSTFSTLRLNLMVFLDRSGHIVFSRAYDLKNNEFVRMPGSFLNYISGKSFYEQRLKTKQNLSGIVLLPEGPLFISCWPILRSDEKGPSRGMLLFGRYLDAAYLKKLADANDLVVDLFMFDEPGLPADIRNAKDLFAGDAPVMIKIMNEGFISGYTIMKGVSGDPSMILKVTMQRDIYRQGLNNFYYFVLSIIVVGFVLGIVIFFLLEELVLSRLTQLNSDVKTIGLSGDLSTRVKITGNDELSLLKKEINRMLEALERSEKAHRESEERYRDLFESANDLIQGVAPDGSFLYVNRAWKETLGYSNYEVSYLTLFDILDPACLEQCMEIFRDGKPEQKISGIEVVLIAKNRSRIIVEGNISLHYKDGKPVAALGIFRDITERKRMEESLRALSLRDELTGLYNRRGFSTLAEQQLKVANRVKKGMLLIFADLDGMKDINDKLGHIEGDRALLDASQVLRKTFRESDIIARYGGDEFVILSLETPETTFEIFENRLREHIDYHNKHEKRPYSLSMSMGFSRYDPDTPLSVDDLLMQADKIMYEQKKGKKKEEIPF